MRVSIVQEKVRSTISIEKGRSGVWFESCVALLSSLMPVLVIFCCSRGFDCQGKEFDLIVSKEIYDENEMCLNRLKRKLSKIAGERN